MSPKKIVLVGYGYWGKKIYHTLKKITNEEIIVFDKAISSDWDLIIRNTDDLDNFLFSLNKNDTFFFIATPEQTHYQLAKKILGSNQPVFIEKPLCLEYEQATELCVLAEKKGTCLFVDRIFLYDEAYLFIKKIITSNELGKIYGVHSVRHSNDIHKIKIAVTDDLAPHDIYLCKELFDVYPQKHAFNLIKKQQTQFFEVKLEWKIQDFLWENWYSWNQYPTQRELSICGVLGEVVWKKEKTGESVILKKGQLQKKYIFSQEQSPLEKIIKDFFEAAFEENEQKRITRYESYIEEISVLESIRVQSSSL